MICLPQVRVLIRGWIADEATLPSVSSSCRIQSINQSNLCTIRKKINTKINLKNCKGYLQQEGSLVWDTLFSSCLLSSIDNNHFINIYRLQLWIGRVRERGPVAEGREARRGGYKMACSAGYPDFQLSRISDQPLLLTLSVAGKMFCNVTCARLRVSLSHSSTLLSIEYWKFWARPWVNSGCYQWLGVGWISRKFQ